MGPRLFYARDIKVGDLLIEYYSNSKDEPASAFLVLKKREWVNMNFDGWVFVIWDLIHEEKREYSWDDEPMTFDDVFSLP